jgi:hypothetical protein
MFLRVLFKVIVIKGVTVQPTDGWEVSLKGKPILQAPEDLDYPQGALDHGIGEIPPGGRDGSNGR